jgi:endonuclease/exonuclease/phosphatase family metal-dependent hydrolase
VEQLKKLNPDVIAVNEANKLPSYARSLARELGFDQLYHVGIGGLRIGPVGLPANLREGDVILARKSLELKRRVRKQLSGGPVGNFFTFHFADATQIIGGRISVAGREIFVFNTHWHASPFPTNDYFDALDRRLEAGSIGEDRHVELIDESIGGHDWRLGEARKTVAFVDRIANDSPVILMGDFNATAGSKEIGILKAAGFRDAYGEAGDAPGFTWDGMVNSNIRLQKKVYPEDFWLEPTRKRIDYVFYRGPGLKVLKSEVVLDTPSDGIHPSDHFGVMADFEVTGEASPPK